jgi:hypothetical protein
MIHIQGISLRENLILGTSNNATVVLDFYKIYICICSK